MDEMFTCKDYNIEKRDFSIVAKASKRSQAGIRQLELLQGLLVIWSDPLAE